MDYEAVKRIIVIYMNVPEIECRLPLAIGNEEETMLMVGPQGAQYSKFGEAVDFVTEYQSYIPDGIKHVGENNNPRRTFLQTGGLVYNGGTAGSGNLERATPECSKPAELAAHMHANEDLLVSMLGQYIQKRYSVGAKMVARAQRRVIDSRGNTRACHDNFEVRNKESWDDFGQTKESEVLLHHLATRSFVTGAGHVDATGLHFAQKAQSVKYLQDYGFISSAYRISVNDDTAQYASHGRVEIRCNDINISPWAAQVRVGGTAILLTMLKTPLAHQLMDNDSGHAVSQSTRIKHFRQFNHAVFTPEFELQRTRNLLHALDYQERIWDIADSQLDKYVEIPEDYTTIIHELQYYCQDFRKVLYGELDMSVLADRSDNAAKFARIIAATRKANASGIPRKLHSVFGMAADMAYDIIEVAPGSSGAPRVARGYGYRLRDKAAFKMPLQSQAVERAFYQPPQTTRAFLRGEAIRRGKVEAASWKGLFTIERRLFRDLGPAIRDESNVDLEMIGIV